MQQSGKTSLDLADQSQRVTLAGKMAAANFRPSGFDYMRLLLAVGVMCVHSGLVAYGPAAYAAFWLTPIRPFARLILPMFFALSGFLVAGSLERTKSLVSFLGLRAIRIYPALGVEVLLSAFVLGPIFTATPLATYFAHPTFHAYLLNVFGDVHFSLPGVFLQNPDRGRVNEQLWTVPYELLCYISLAALAVMKVVRFRLLAIVGGVALIGAHVAHRMIKYGALFIDGPISGELLVASFLFGVAIYLYREQLAWSWRWLLGCAVAAILLAGLVPMGDLLLPPVAAYLTMLIGLSNPPRIAIIRGADYSYGMFLYGFAIQQAFTTMGPWTHVWWMNIVVCVPASALFAAFSWHAVEKPALKLRKSVMAVESWYLGLRGSPNRAT